eukprot:GHVO01069410.1.p1 GENE.GHVO01069410.1~~GHVO01069410.1.p1  ORF type:complete len:431 (+),score=35.22 GHVO01069410.1:29-1321(+)
MGLVCSSGPRQPSDFSKSYILGKKLGSGSFATAYICEHIPTKTFRVAKVVKKAEYADFQIETRILSRISALNCANVVKYYDAFVEDDGCYVIMEYCSGGSLMRRMESQEIVTEREVARWISQILSALQQTHSLGIIHRDVKPDNILLDKAGKCIKVIDFGLSCYVSPGMFVSAPCGTPQFMAPEVILCQYDSKADIWACGVLLYLILYGRIPFAGDSQCDMYRRILHSEPLWKPAKASRYKPSELAVNLCKALLNKKPKRRPSATQALAHKWFRFVQIEDQPRVPKSHRRSARKATECAKKAIAELSEFPHPDDAEMAENMTENVRNDARAKTRCAEMHDRIMNNMRRDTRAKTRCAAKASAAAAVAVVAAGIPDEDTETISDHVHPGDTEALSDYGHRGDKGPRYGHHVTFDELDDDGDSASASDIGAL